MTKQWQVGFVGLRRGSGLVRSLAAHPHVQVAALCDLEEDSLTKLGADFALRDQQLFTKFDDFVNAPLDIVVIATPIEFHAPQAITALESGKHVLCEQTAAYTLAECEQLVNTVHKSGRVYMMAENYCYFHYIREWKKLIDQNKLGKIFHAEGEYLHEIVDLLIDPVTGKRRWRYPRAPIWYCAHCLGPLLTLMDDRIVKATGVHSGKNIYPGEEGLGFLDMEVGLFQTQKGATIKILRSQVAPRHHELIFYSLYGTKGFVETGREGGWDGTQGRLYLEEEMSKKAGAQLIECSTVDPYAPAEARAGGHGTSEYYMVRDFITAIEQQTKPPIDIARAIDFTAPGICAHTSAMQGGAWIDVPLF
ncbi:MAG: Gfo/Idh/MocA family oxidoreductase [Caldilineaceae bacterium]|nr:Gfo/Idh/MocA family oxidoreductase [Caldilineaceae bacterium]